jgi:ATP-dependent exoDNAse (exonuclease V) alpha subunit
MTCPYFDAKIIGRSSGRSAVASAAYRAGASLFDARAEKRFNYQNRDGIMHSEIITPPDAPAWASDREQLWNKVETVEKRKDAQLARDIIAALPRELDLAQNTEFVRDFVNANFVSRGMIADFSIHESDAGDGGKNPHVHIMLTFRPIEGEGFGKKAREWNDHVLATAWRSSWETLQNAYLEEVRGSNRFSMLSYEAQGINKEPQQHLGPDAHQLEAEGVETRIGDHNRGVDHRNDLREAIAGYFAPLPDESEALGDEPILDVPIFSFAETGPILSPAEEHQQTLAEYFRVTVERTVEAAGEMVNRLSDWFERTAEIGMNALHRFLGDDSSGRDRGWER